jgi:hypothetical protein
MTHDLVHIRNGEPILKPVYRRFLKHRPRGTRPDPTGIAP